MDTNKLKQLVEKVLKKDDRLWNEEKTELNQTLLIDLVEHIDEKVIELLLQDKELREKFFVKIKDVYVFKTNDFRFFIEENKIDNSFTDYKNRIGLTDGKKFLKDTNDVVLDFPYKDCVLEGGQSTEEGTDTYFEYEEEKTKTVKGEKVTEEAGYKEKQGKRKEIFFNSVLAHDEIDRLFDPKALTSWKRFTKDGEQKVKEIKRDEDGTIKENLIIKGNNLLALHSLKKQFTGKVKLIYIDPPYNTGSDSFVYNDSFNHSAWLTFMKNRLEISKNLLKNDGLILVQCDYNQDSYLKVLMDDIFTPNLYITTITVKSNSISGNKTQHKDKTILKNKDSIIVYKNNRTIKLSPQYTEKFDWDTHYNSILETDEKGNYSILRLKDVLISEGIIDEKYTVKPESINDSKFYEFVFKNKEKIFRGVNSIPKELKSLSLKNKDKVVHVGNGDDKMFAYNGSRLSFLSKSFKEINGEIKMAQLLGDLWVDIDFQNTQNEGGVSLPNGKKPEALLRRIIDLTTSEKDIVLDYHLGSGTTCAVAHKMGRQYIGIEQLDYGENDSVVRLQNVTNGDRSGISKSINWKGGGDFIYFELAKWNETAKEKILACESLEELIKFFDEMYERYFLNYNLKIKEFREKVINEEEFKNLSLDEQKKMFIAMLDNNQMYVNKTEMADKKFGIDKEDQNLTSQFYNSEK